MRDLTWRPYPLPSGGGAKGRGRTLRAHALHHLPDIHRSGQRAAHYIYLLAEARVRAEMGRQIVELLLLLQLLLLLLLRLTPATKNSWVFVTRF